MKKILFLSLTFLSILSLKCQDFHGRMDDTYDLEDIENSYKWSHFQFSGTELSMIMIGIILIVFSALNLNRKNEKSEGCLFPGLLILGVIFIWPLISGILSLIGTLVKGIIFLALIIGGIYLVINILKSLFSK